MPRRRIPVEEDDVSLFPFLSVIAAVIGVLTLMIAAVTLGQMNQEDVKDAVKRAIEMDRLQKQLSEVEDAAEELKLRLEKEKAQLLNSANARQNELVKTRAELESLLKQLAAAQKQAQEKQAIKIVIPEIPKEQRETLDDLQDQLAEIKKRLAVLTRDLNNRKKPPEEAQVSVLPSGSGLSFTPHFVECRAGAIVLHTQDKPLTIRTAEIGANKQFVALLEKVANRNNQTIVFLLRSDGLAAYRTARSLCIKNNVRNGKLPVVGNGRLDLSHFRTKSK